MNFKILFSIFIFLIAINVKAQKTLEAFANLVPGTWISEGKQLGLGRWSLERKISRRTICSEGINTSFILG